MITEAYLTRHFITEPASNAGSLSLSLLIAQHSFSYAIFADASSKPIELCSIALEGAEDSKVDLANQVSMLVDNYQLLKKKFDRVNISFLGADFSMVPAAYADGSADKDILAFISGNADRRIMRQTVAGIRFIYGLDPDLFNYLERSFSNASFRHAGMVNIGLLLTHHALSTADLYLDISENTMQLSIRRNGEIIFYNVFNCNTNEDVLYYLLFTMEQFGFDPLFVKLAIASDRPVTDALLQSLSTYIKQISFVTPHTSLSLTGKFAELPSHFYFTLLNQHLCES